MSEKPFKLEVVLDGRRPSIYVPGTAELKPHNGRFLIVKSDEKMYVEEVIGAPRIYEDRIIWAKIMRWPLIGPPIRLSHMLVYIPSGVVSGRVYGLQGAVSIDLSLVEYMTFHEM